LGKVCWRNERKRVTAIWNNFLEGEGAECDGVWGQVAEQRKGKRVTVFLNRLLEGEVFTF